MNVARPAVSIIMPAYNAERYIVEAIRSLLEQSLTDWELIVVDDGSTDDTGKIIQSFDDPRIRYFRQSNRGVGAARNLGIAKVRGDYITFLDADDLLPAKSLEYRVQYLEKHPDIDIVDGIVSIMDESLENELKEYRPYYTGRLLPRLAVLDDKVFFGINYLFRKKSLGNVRFNEIMSHAEDLLFFLQIADSGATRYGSVPEPVYIYRQRNDSAMANLEGLERGYIELLAQAGKLNGMSFKSLAVMRLKVVKIMFLSWLKRGEVSRATLSTWRLATLSSSEQS